MEIHEHYEHHHDLGQDVDKHDTLETAMLIIASLTAVHIPFIVLANFVVIFTIVKIEKLHTPQNVILACIAVCDLMYGLTIIPMDIITTFDYSVWHSTFLCWLRLSTYRFVINISLSFLMLMTIERFIAISFVFHYSKITNDRVIGAAIVFVILEIFKGPIFAYIMIQNDKKVCTYAASFDIVHTVIYDRMKLGIQLLISVVLSLHVACVAWRQNKKIAAQITLESDRRRHILRMSQVKISISLMFIFVIVWLLALGTSLLAYISHSHNELFGANILRVIQVYSLLIKHLLAANSFINPIVYALVKPTFKTAFMFLIRNRPCMWDELQEVIREEWRALTQTTQVNLSSCQQSSTIIDKSNLANGESTRLSLVEKSLTKIVQSNMSQSTIDKQSSPKEKPITIKSSFEMETRKSTGGENLVDKT